MKMSTANTFRGFLCLVVFALVMSSHAATTYTWTGASDGNWSNAPNWNAYGIPVDEYTGVAAAVGLNGEFTIVFSGTTMPSSNVPDMGGWVYGSGYTDNTPFLDLRSGGTLSVDFVSQQQDGFWVEPYSGLVPTILTLGDGVSGVNEDVTLDVADDLYLARISSTTNDVVINADGTLDVAGDMYTAFHTNNSASTIFDLNGGSIVVGGNLTIRGSATRFDLSATNAQISVAGTISDPNASGAYFDLQELGAEVTAAYGGDFADLAAVEAATGTTFRATGGDTLYIYGNGASTFTVTTTARGGESTFSDIIQFGWRINEAALDGATRIIDWMGQYTNLSTGAYSANGSQGSFNDLTVAQGPHLDDPVSSLSMTGSQCWAYHEVSNGTFAAWQHAVWVKEGSTLMDANESLAFSFNQPVKLLSIGWQSFKASAGDAAELSYAGNVETNTSSTLYDLGETLLLPGDELMIKALGGDGFRVSAVVVAASAPATNTMIAPDNVNIHYQGSHYITSDADGAYFQRHSDAVLALPSGTSGFSATKARTTSGMAMLFRTASASVDMDFTIEPDVENRGSTFAVYENGAFLGTHAFDSAVSNMSFSISSVSPGTPSIFRVVFPHWSKPDFRGMELDAGAALLPYTPPAKRSYVVLGDSISHGVGQASTYLTYPWLLAEMLNVELFNLAVGGAKVSVPSAEMLSAFPSVDVISILVGYNDLHFADKTTAEFATDLDAQISAVRTAHPDAELFCISQTFTTNAINPTTGENIADFRQAVSNVVAVRQGAGDTHIHLIQGEAISDASFLLEDDAVHFSEPGAAQFATNLFLLMDPIVNSTQPVVSPQAGTNILFIAIDDMKPMLGCYGDTRVQSPRIDGLASNGVTFLNAQCQWAVCGPSRASLMTGFMPEQTGVLGFKKMRGLSDSGSADATVTKANVVTLQQHFRYNGYRTAATGKINDNRCVGSITDLATGKVLDDGRDVDDPPSWGDPVDPYNLPADFFTSSSYVKPTGGWSPNEGGEKPSVGATNLADSAFSDGIICDEGITLLQNLAAGDTQFFLGVGFKKPHLPFAAPQQYWDLYDRGDFTVHPFQQHPTGEVSYTWNYAAELGTYTDIDDPTNIPEAKQLELIHGYYACVSFIDTLVGRLIDELETLELHTNTVVVLWGDHGFHLGDHAEWGKHTNLEQAARVPLVIYSPFTGVTGATTEAPANFTDLYPTICGLAGLSVPEQPLNEDEAPTTPASGLPLYGKSLVPVMQTPTSSVRTGALTVFRRSGAMGYAYRTEQYRLIEWVSTSTKVTLARELYDYDGDPMETLNLASGTTHDHVISTLSNAMRSESEAAGCPVLSASSALGSPGTITIIR